MRRLLAAVAVAATALLSAAPAHAGDTSLVDHTEWVKWGDLSSLRVYPTQAARAEAAQLGTMSIGQTAWEQVLAQAPDADLPGMREQFLCHWQLAEFAQPGKTSWNLEPWRPEVDAATMIETGCNPGGTEEPF
ncbi:DUF2599 domain-containing protein [Mycolicibacterium confluentis]|uniref:Uncharacterized protein n=1 Tax=Mycolicibacterium confluentis TaxID=28047 RepID=A0A7I7Y1E5_9MYCO|nr:DUF2599 domain-containing protein [Mycolicibacterium confluentis]MCV7320409.1 DUF2599 domain-containing protein [Mycolicibacterium confluentis]ORV21869.1 hypothetical protein AWB99_05875 [Mycolicibacterium confluentis]BBZ35448.1 hypothetical protein MCNF_40530 [Mycolicibacterium confluentis]